MIGLLPFSGRNKTAGAIPLKQEGSTYNLDVAKIVGASSETEWSQVHAFMPTDPDKRSTNGGLVGVFALQAKQEGVDIASFGTELIRRFHELYFSTPNTNIPEKLKNICETVEAEFSKHVEICLLVSVFIDGYEPLIYLGGKNAGARLYRNGQIIPIMPVNHEFSFVSGLLQNRDIFILGTTQFFQFISKTELREVLEGRSLEEIKDELASLVGANDTNSMCAAAVTKVACNKVKPALKPEIPNQNKLSWHRFVSSSLNGIRILLESRREEAKTRNYNLTLAIILIVLLVVSSIFGYQKRRQVILDKDQQQLSEKVTSQYRQAVSIAPGSPMQAKEILTDAQKNLSKYLNSDAYKLEGRENKELQLLLAQIDQELQSVTKEYRFEPEVFADLTLIKAGFSGQSLAGDGTSAVVTDNKNSTVVSVDLDTKEGKIIAGGDQMKSVKAAVTTSGYFVGLGQGQLIAGDAKSGKIINQKNIADLGTITDIRGFGGNVYLLGQGEIYKFSVSSQGLSDKIDYLVNTDPVLSDSVSFAVDGSVWVLTGEGQILKYTRGARDGYSVKDWDTVPGPQSLVYTSADCDNLYILDKKNTKIIVLGKSGEYKGSYVWAGIAGAQGIVVWEKQQKAYLLTGGRIYSFTLK